MKLLKNIRNYTLLSHEQKEIHKRRYDITVAFLLICIMVMSCIAGSKSAYAATITVQNSDGTYTDIDNDTSLQVTYNGIAYTDDIFPGIRVNNVWMVPVKEFLADTLGCTYEYTDADGKLTITNSYGTHSVSTELGSTELNTGSSVLTMAVPVIKAGNSESADAETIYVPASKTIQYLGFGYESTSTTLKVTDNISFYQKSDETSYENTYKNALNSIICTKDLSGNDIIRFTTLNDIVASDISAKAGVDSIEYIYKSTKNLLGDIDKIFDNGTIKSINIWEEESSTHIKVVYDGKYVTSKSVIASTFTITLKKGSFSMKVIIPEGVKADKITATDRYWNKQFYIIIPGNHVSFYKENKPINNTSAIKKITVNNTSNGKTRIVVTTNKLRGYKITKKDGYFLVKVGSPKSIYKNIILLDAGHGGRDSGAVHGKLYEKRLNLEILYTRARKYFESNSSNVKAYWTRHNDKFINLYTRPKLSKTYSADMFLSLHMNSAGSRFANGTEIYYSSNNNKVTNTGLYSRKMASMMLNTILEGVNSQNRGVRQAGFVVTKYNSVPSILVELGFITGNKDYPNLKKPVYREKAAKALYDGVEKIFKKYPTNR